jgi:hypothetical protein
MSSLLLSELRGRSGIGRPRPQILVTAGVAATTVADRFIAVPDRSVLAGRGDGAG